MTLTVNVTREHIERGREHIRFADQCPIALAIKEQHPREWLWLVKAGVILRWPGHPIPLPPAAVEFNRAALAGETLKPFAFELELDERRTE